MTHRSRIVVLIAFLGATLPAVPSQGLAQPSSVRDSVAVRGVTLAGIVRDTLGRPLVGAEVRAGRELFDVSEVDGSFRIAGVDADTVQLVVRRIGYHPADVLLAIDPGLRQVDLAVTMVPYVVELGTIVIEGQTMNRHLWRNGFYDRQKQGRGYLFDPERLARYGGSLSTLVREVPGLDVRRSRFGESFAYGRSGSATCRVAVFVDGMHLRWADEVGLENIIARHDILAVEVYPRSMMMPSTLRGAGSMTGVGGIGSPGQSANLSSISGGECGALVIWTKPLSEG